jgi:hypothetical protein
MWHRNIPPGVIEPMMFSKLAEWDIGRRRMGPHFY